MNSRSCGAGLGFLFSVFLCATGWGQQAMSSPPPAVRSAGRLRLFINDVPIEEKIEDYAVPRLREGTLYIPLSDVFPFSAIVTGRTGRIQAYGKDLLFVRGQNDVLINRRERVMLSAPVLFVPISSQNETPIVNVPRDFFEKVLGDESVVNLVGDKVYVKLPPLNLPVPSRPSYEPYTPPSYPYYPQPTYNSTGSGVGAVFFVVMLVILFIGIAIAVQASQRNSLNNVYRIFAQRVSGTLQEGSMWTFPSVLFSHDGASALLDIFSTGGKNSTHYTQLTFTFYNAPSFRCEISPEGFWQEVGKFFGMQDIEVGYRTFDDHFVVRSDDIETVKSFLNAAVQQELIKLKRLRRNDHIYLSMSSSRLQIRKLSLLNRLEDLTAFYESSGRICDELMTLIGANGAGAIQILEVSFEGEEEAPTCQICGDQITSNRVICRRCRTPHHRDCWEYNGGCAVYACKERRYTVK
jgi:hypothetical protein